MKTDCANLIETDKSRLERLCSEQRDGIWTAPPEKGIERIEARFKGEGFSPHRHDTYAIGLTLSGVQTFNYRGESRASLPGQIITIHPDEVHDGGAGSDIGLRYRMIYIPPDQIREALVEESQSQNLPFVEAPVLSDVQFQKSLVEALDDIDHELGELKRVELLAALSFCLSKHARSAGFKRSKVDKPALQRCAGFLQECSDETVRMQILEDLSGMNRFLLTRQFKSFFGTSPYRYLVMRRLERVKTYLVAGKTLSEAALESGFADQSHMNRHFKKAFGIAPGHWRQLLRKGHLSTD